MKINIYLIVLVFVLMIGCENQNKEYPNVTIGQVIQNIRWNESYSDIKEMFENSYGLEFDKEIEQKEGDINNKVYKFSGGKINGIRTQSWAVTFNNDSLDFVVIIVESKTKEQNTNTFQELKRHINTLTYDKYSKEDNFWILSKNGKGKSGIQLIRNEQATAMTFSSNRYINKYSYL